MFLVKESRRRRKKFQDLVSDLKENLLKIAFLMLKTQKFRLRRWFALTFRVNMYNFHLWHWFFKVFALSFQSKNWKYYIFSNIALSFQSKNNVFVYLARRRRKIFAITGIILSILCIFLLLFKYCFVAIKQKSSWEKNLMKKNPKSCTLLKRPKIAFLGEIFFSRSQAKSLELSFPHRVFNWS